MNKQKIKRFLITEDRQFIIYAENLDEALEYYSQYPINEIEIKSTSLRDIEELP